MAKGKKTIIKDIKLLDDDIIQVNGKEYQIVQSDENINILEANSMKITSKGNRILRFENSNKIVTIDLKRDIQVFKIQFMDNHRASRFKKLHDTSIISHEDKQEIIANTSSYIKAREIIAKYTNKSSPLYDKNSGKNIFYLGKEIKS